MKKTIQFLGIATLLAATACNNNKIDNQNNTQKDTTSAQAASDSLNKKPKEPANKPSAIVTTNTAYEAWPIKGSDSLTKALKQFSEEEMKVIETLNRADAKHLSRIDTIIIPKEFGSVLSFTPFPTQVSNLTNVPKIILFDYFIQAFAVYEQGKLVKWGPTNMGKKATPTPLGLKFANWKGKEIRSSVNKNWILKWNFNVHNTLGVGWHEYALPGYPVSHSCMRLLAEDAKWLYDWAEQWRLKDGKLMAKGTPTIVYGAYPWGERRPWKSILEDPKSLDISEEKMNEITAPYLDEILKAQEERKAYLSTLETTSA